MRQSKAKKLRKKAETMTKTLSNKRLIRGENGQLIHKDCTRNMYQTLKSRVKKGLEI